MIMSCALMKLFINKSIAAVVISILLLSSVSLAQAETTNTKAADLTIFHADIVGGWNPEGIMLVSGGFHRWAVTNDQELNLPDFYREVGAMIGLSPAYAQISIYGEWKPAVFAQLRVQYDYYGFFGVNGSLLSFPSAESTFGKDEIDSLSGKEESASGHRLLFQPVLTVKIGPVIIRNTTDFGYYLFSGKGPYYHEAEYDTLLKDGDLLVNNNTAFLMEAWKGSNYGMLLAGPFYEITHAVDAKITRQRTGVQYYWLPAKTLWGVNQPRFYGQVGMNLQDRNRDNEPFLEAGAGFDF